MVPAAVLVLYDLCSAKKPLSIHMRPVPIHMRPDPEICQHLAILMLREMDGIATDADRQEIQKHADADPAIREWLKLFDDDCVLEVSEQDKQNYIISWNGILRRVNRRILRDKLLWPWYVMRSYLKPFFS